MHAFFIFKYSHVYISVCLLILRLCFFWTYKCFVALLCLTVFSSQGIPLAFFIFILLFSFSLSLAKLLNTFHRFCTYVLYMHFQCIHTPPPPPDMYEAVIPAYHAVKALFSLDLWPRFAIYSLCA